MSRVIIPSFLLPNDSVDLNKFSVVACDQFTSQREYWQQLSDYVGDSISTLNLIYPEVYLNDNDKKERIEKIHTGMRKYLNDGVFVEHKGLVYVKRIDSLGNLREGLMIAIDLEEYDYTPQNNAVIKATEKTVVERLPARIEVRQGASLEFPHIMLLMDDEKDEIFGKIRESVTKKIYDFELNMKGGSISGYSLDNQEEIINKIERLSENVYAEGKQIMFAVGDGNHSLATAKECWNNIKANLSEQEKKTHKARYALCELVNLYDKSLKFEPIHRVVYGGGREYIDYLKQNVGGQGKCKLVFDGKEEIIDIPLSESEGIADLQKATDEFLAQHPNAEIDYIHGDDYLLEIAKRNNAVAVFMPTISKESLFKFVATRGVLPRKSFSMGNAEDKRYYLEGRKIL